MTELYNFIIENFNIPIGMEFLIPIFLYVFCLLGLCGIFYLFGILIEIFK